MRRTIIAVLALTATLGGADSAREARAQPANTDRAIDAGRTAARLYDEGKWAEALARFQEADQAAHSVVFVVYMARCQRKLGDLAAARRSLESVIAETLPPEAPEPMRRAQADAAAELGEVREEMARADERARLRAAAPASTAATRAPSMETAPSATEPGPIWPGVVVLGAGVIGLGIGGVTGAMALSETSSIEEGCEGTHCLKTDEARGDRASTLAAVSTVAFIAGGVAAAAGVVLLVVRPGGPPATNAGALSTLSVSASGRGAWLSGRF